MELIITNLHDALKKSINLYYMHAFGVKQGKMMVYCLFYDIKSYYHNIVLQRASFVSIYPSFHKEHLSADSYSQIQIILDIILINMRAIYATITILLIALAYADTVKIREPAASFSDRLSSIATIVYVPEEGKRQPNGIYKFVDNALKNKYWYYLSKARLIYAAAVEKGESYQFLAIYRNIVGTFLAITTWKNQTDVFQVNTLVRLGNGDAKQFGANYNPVDVNLQYFRFALGKDEFIIYSADGSGNDLNGDIKDLLLVKECKAFSDSIRKSFWYYISGSDVVYSSVAQTAAKNYCMVIYVNLSGTFFVIGDEERATKTCKANTFVRLGQGAAPSSAQDLKQLNEPNTVLKIEAIHA